MAYYIYERRVQQGKVHLIYQRPTCLAGYKNGIIPLRLRESVPKDHPNTFGWTIQVSKEYNARNEAVLIDIKPSGDELFYCELDTAFGVCYRDEWTTIMYRMKRLFPYEERGRDEDHFIYDGTGHEVIYTTLYFKGSFAEGRLAGKWVSPAKSSTNGVLLWPDTATFFFKKIREFDPNFLEDQVAEITVS